MSSKNCFSRAKDKNANLESTYPCTICKKTFKEFIIFEGHFAFNAECSANNGMLMQCYVCGMKFHHFSELKYHLNLHYGNKTLESGENCRIPLKRKSSQRRHKHVRRVQSGQRRNSYKCTICGVSFSSSSNLGTFSSRMHPIDFDFKIIIIVLCLFLQFVIKRYTLE